MIRVLFLRGIPDFSLVLAQSIFWLFFIFPVAYGSDQRSQIILTVGLQRTINSRGALVTLGNGRIAGIKEIGGNIVVTGKKPGKTFLTLGRQQYTIDVLSQRNYRVYSRIREVLSDFNFKGLSLDVENGTIDLVGQLYRLEDWKVLASKLGADDEFRFRAMIDPDLENEVQDWLRELIGQAMLPPLKIVLRPFVSALLEEERTILKSRYQMVLGRFGVSLVQDRARLHLEPMVRVKITVAEVKKKEFQKLGILWQENYQATLVPATGISNVALQIHALEENGLGKILASPNLLCRSGKEAHFLAGGEFPIKVVNFKTHDVVWKKHGIMLTVQPKADFQGRMSIAIKTEVSTIDESQTVDGIPGLQTNRIESHFDLEESRTIALSGLIKNEWGKAYQGLPWLSRIPILGRLFSSEGFRNQQTELVLFVTPQVVSGRQLEESESSSLREGQPSQ